MNRREFLISLGFAIPAVKTFVAFPRAIWTPQGSVDWDGGMVVVNPKVRDALIDIMQNAVPMDTFFLGKFSNVPVRNIRHEWVLDGLE